MKTKFTKLLSLILTVALLISAFAIYASAETTEGGEEEDAEAPTPRLMVYRTYDEGWDFSNGTGDSRKENNFYVDYETTVDYSYNYFFRIEATNGQDGFSQMSFSSAGYPCTEKIFVEFDLKIDDYCNMGNIIYSRTNGGTSSGVTMNLSNITNNTYRPFGNSGSSIPIGDEWIHICIVFDYTDEEMLNNENAFMAYQYVTTPDGVVHEYSNVYNANPGLAGMDIIRIGRPSGQGPIGSSYCLDNLVIYYNASEAVDWDVEKDGYGTLVNANASKTIPIKGAVTISPMDAVKQGLAMKVGVSNSLLKNVKTPIKTNEQTGEVYGAPVVVNGEVLVPLEAVLEYVGYPLYIHPDGESYDISTGTSASYITVGRDTATVDGERIELTVAPGYAGEGDNKYLVIALADVETLFPGVYVTYDDMGLIILCEVDEVLKRETDMTAMLDIMKEFIFEYFTQDEIYEDVSTTTENFQHPYLVADQARFDELRAIYLAEEGDENYDADIKTYIQNQIKSADNYYKQYGLPAGVDENGESIWDTYAGLDKQEQTLYNPYPETNGYDPHGGRLNESGQQNNKMMQLAFAYQMTRDIKYALLAYDFGIAMAAWEHWGPGHFLNAADAAAPYAMATDWIYNAIVEYSQIDAAYDINKLVDGAYKNGTWAGYYGATTGLATHASTPRGSAGNNANYYNTANNWNAVCASGMIMCSLLTMEREEYKDQSTYLAVHNFEHLCRNGLGQYAPDGSYVESPGYWSYGTNTLFRLAMTLEYAAGTDYDLFNCWGLEKTCYFACQSESSDYATFNYHDGGVQQQDCSYFFYVARSTGDAALATIRLGQLKGGKSCTLMDLLYFPVGSYAINSDEPVELPLDYYMEGIDAFVARSSWEKGSMYVGIIGGMNNASHGQVDSGDWVYDNLGTRWIYDLGADNYNVYSYWSQPTRYMYYKMNAEGNNTLALVSKPSAIPFGQNLDQGGKIIENGYNEHGSYTIIDNTAVYGEQYASYAYRGMFVTNDRKTVIIQDEVSLVGIESLYWFAHFNLNTITEYSVAGDGRSATLTDKKGNTLRLSLVSKSLDFKFEIMDCYTFFLQGANGTVNKDFSTTHGGVAEHSRTGFNKLAIRGDNVLSFNVAVVIEIIDRENPIDVGYQWTPMADWTPYADTRAEGNTTVILKRDNPKKSSLSQNVRKATDYINKGTAYTDAYKQFYRALTDIQYTINFFDDSDFTAEDNDTLDAYYDLLLEYTSFTESVNTRVEDGRGIVNSILGRKSAAAE